MSYLLLVVLLVVYVNGCYWNAPCRYELYGSKTPYNAVRGDIRDLTRPANCKAVSIWSLHRHGNRNPSNSNTEEMKQATTLKDEIISSFYNGNSQLCAQEIEDFRNWDWKKSMDGNPAQLTSTGYNEVYAIGKRIRETYPHLLNDAADQFYIRATNKQRTVDSAAAFINGLTEGTNLNVSITEANDFHDPFQAYKNCDRYHKDVKDGQFLDHVLETYFNSPNFLAMQKAVQTRLGIATNLNTTMIFAIYDLCRFYRSWTPDRKSPWCAVFTDEELALLEYHDDLKHYYKNGYGSWVNQYLGRMPLKYLYESFTAFVKGGGRPVSAHFSHDTVLEMVYSALGLDKDPVALQPMAMDPNRLWRTSYIGSFSTNLIAVLNSCVEPGQPNVQSYRVQIFVNEWETPICPPVEGCTWGQFLEKFQQFADANLDFCERISRYGSADRHSNNDNLRQEYWPWNYVLY